MPGRPPSSRCTGPNTLGFRWDRIDDLDVASRGKAGQGGAGILQTGAKTLTPVAGDEDQAALRIEERKARRLFGAERGVVPEAPDDVQKRVDHRVSGDHDAALADALAAEIAGRLGGWGEVDVGERVGQRTVHLFGPRRAHIAGAQSRLHVSHRDLAVERGQRGGQGRRRIAVHQHAIGLEIVENPTHAAKHGLGDMGEVLVGAHNIQVIVRRYGEQGQDLVQHVAVLGGDADSGLDAGLGRQRLDHRRHLNRLGPSSEYAENSHARRFAFLK